MGLAPTAPVALVPALPSVDTADEATAAGPDAIELRNVELARLRREYEVSEEALRLEVQKQYPDLTLGPLFESDEGQSRIGFLGGIPLPFLNANRRAIAEARAEREIARAALEGAYEELVGRWAAETAWAESLASQREELVEMLVPLVDRQVEEAFELLRLGEHATTLVLLESLTRAFQAKLELLNTRAAETLARTEIAFLIGPEATSEASPDPSGAAEEER
jgi:outer membrane protein TolC